MTTNQKIGGVLVSRELVERAISAVMLARGPGSPTERELRALLDAPTDTRTETVPKHKFDTLVQHCKLLDGEIAQARAHVNEITLYQQNAVWFWQHDGQDFIESLSCPIIIQPHHLRELLKGVVPAAQPQGEPVAWMQPGQDAMCISHKVKLHSLKIGGAPASAVVVYSIPLYAEQPAPVAVVMPVDPERERLMEIVQQYPNVDPLKYDAAVRTLRK